MNRGFWIVLTLLILHVFGANGEFNSNYDINSIYFETISTKDELPNSVIYKILQDSLGFIWLASDDGLIRYDGLNFKLYTSTNNNLNTITNNYFYDMHLDSSGNPWLLFPGVLDKIDVKTGKIIHYKRVKNQPVDFFLAANQFILTPENNIFIASRRNGLYMLHHNDTLIQNLFSHKQIFPEISSQLEAIAYKGNCLYIGRKQDGIYQLYLNEDNSKILNVQKIASTTHNQIITILPDQNDNLWVGTSQGIIHIKLKTGSSTTYESKLKNNQFLPESEVLSLFVDDSNHLWIGTRENGLSIVSISEIEAKAENAKSVRYSRSDGDGSLSNRCINTIFRDRNNAIWLGTYSGGVQLITDYREKIHSIKYIPGHPESISHQKVWGITEDQKGNIWIGSDGGGIDVWHPKKGIFQRFKRNNNGKGLSDNAILCALTGVSGKLWFGTYRGGVNRINPETNDIKVYESIPTATAGISTSDIRALYQGGSGRIWVGTNSAGICYYDTEKDSFINIPELGNIDVRAFLEREDEYLWIGTRLNGLICYNLKSKAIKAYQTSSTSKNCISSNSVNHIKEGTNGKLWLGTIFGGLSSLDTHNEIFENFDSRDGLANNTVHAILRDTKGYYWLSTNVGISRFDPLNKSFINYNQENGVLPGEFLNSSCIAASDGTFYFGSSNGLNYFDPDFIKPSELTPDVVFTDLKIFNEHIIPGNGIIDSNIEFNPAIRLNHEHSVYTVEFQAIQYPFANKCEYSYMLDGFDEQWNFAGVNNAVTYRQLPAGNYVLKVKASNSDGIWSEKIASIPIIIKPPLWKTMWAYLIYAFILFFITRFVYRSRMNIIKTTNQLHYEKKIRQQEQSIHRERLIFFTNISHELRTPLTMVECAVDDLKNSLKSTRNSKISESIKTASFHSARLLELINQLLEFRRIETGTPQISAEYLNLNEWLSEYLKNFKEMSDNKSISMSLSMPITNIELCADPDKLSMIMNNLLSNAFKFTPKKGTIKIKTKETEKEVIIEVINSGTGISTKALPHIFERYYKTENHSTSTGIGLSLTKSLVKLHHGKISASSSQGKETRLILTFLKGDEHFEAEQLKKIDDIKTKEPDIIIEEKTDHQKSREKNIMLIIEDNEDISSMLEAKFTPNYKVYTAEDGEKGIDLAQKYIPDIVISDIMMPGIQGTEVCKIIKNTNTTSHVPIILLTAKGTIEDELSGLTTGADDYISKPFNFKILEARVNTLLRNRISLSNYFSEKDTAAANDQFTDTRKQQEHAFLKKVEDLILEKYLHSEASVFQVAKDLNFSRSSLYRKIKILTGKSINEFIRSVKIKKAAQLIASKDITISEAAYAVGFNDLKYFRKCFVQQIGETPSDFKKKILAD